MLLTHLNRRRLMQAGAVGFATAALSPLLAACGGDDDDDDSSGGDATATSGTAANTPAAGETPAADSTPTSSGASGSGGTPQAGGSLSMSLADSDATNFDPIVPTDNMSIWTMLLFYDQVVRVGPDGVSVEPGLAESWEVSEDGLTYTFALRDATFHDGNAVTADDCQYCLNRVVTDETSQWAWIFTSVDKYEASDDSTLVATLKQASAPFLADLCLYSASIFPKAAHEAQQAALFDNPIGSGAFKWDSWEKEVQIVLKKNDAYWEEGKPYLDELTFKVLPDANQRMLQFQSKELDIATNVPFSQLDALRNDSSVQLVTDAVARLDYLGINCKTYSDVKVRQAMNYAVDKDAIITNVLFGAGELATTAIPKMLYWAPSVAGYPYDLEKAKSLMAESEMADGFSASVIISTGDPVEAQIATLIQANLKEIGIELEIEQVEPGGSGSRIRSYDYDLYKGYYTTDIIDPDELASFAIYSSGGAEAVWTGFNDPEIDQLGLDATAETDPAKREELYKQIQQKTTDAAHFLYLFYPTGRTAVATGINGFKILSTGNYRLYEVWRDQ